MASDDDRELVGVAGPPTVVFDQPVPEEELAREPVRGEAAVGHLLLQGHAEAVCAHAVREVFDLAGEGGGGLADVVGGGEPDG